MSEPVANDSDTSTREGLRVVSLGNGRYQLDANGAHRVAFAVVLGGDTWVFLDGRVYVVPAAGTVARRARADDDTALMAPMPATVIGIHVTPGQTVGRDDLLLTLEAMKMELSIKAPREGRVITIACRPGELVQPGVRLMEIDYGS